jgi:hypothetical protein
MDSFGVVSKNRSSTHAAVVGVPPRRGSEVKAHREAKGAEEDRGHKDRVALEEGGVDWLWDEVGGVMQVRQRSRGKIGSGC